MTKNVVITSVVTITKPVLVQAQIEVDEDGTISDKEMSAIRESILSDFKKNWKDAFNRKIDIIKITDGVLV